MRVAKPKKFFLILGALSQAGCSVFGIRSEENPNHQVLHRENNKEIRKYSPHIIAKTKVSGEYKAAQRESFRILAGYIFGDNEKKQKIPMTAPVAVRSSDKTKGEKIAMTAPVTMTGGQNLWTMTFLMPSRYNMEDLPTPNDKRVEFEAIPEKTFGVVSFSGFESVEKNSQKVEELQEWLRAFPQYEVIGNAVFAGYDPPWTLPFLRKNEMMLELRSK